MNHKQLVDLIIENKSFELSESILKEPNKYEVEFFTTFNNENLYKVLPKDILIHNLIDELLKKYEQVVLPELDSIIRFSEWILTLFDETPQNNKYKNQKFITNYIIPQFLIDKGFKIRDNVLIVFREIDEVKKIILNSFSKVIYQITEDEKLVFQIYKLCFNYELKIWDNVKKNSEDEPLKAEILILENLNEFSEQYHELLRAILLGVCLGLKRESFSILEEVFKKEDLQYIVINSLIFLQRFSKGLEERMLDLAEKCSDNEKNFKELSWLYLSIWNNNYKNVLGKRCYFTLLNIVSSNNLILQKYILSNLSDFRFSEKAVIKILKAFIENSNHNKEVYIPSKNGNSIDWILEKIENPFYFFYIIEELYKKVAFQIDTYLENIIIHHSENSSDINSRFIMLFCTSNIGRVRELGKDLLSIAFRTYSADYDKKLKKKLLILDTESQIKFLLLIGIDFNFDIKLKLKLITQLVYSSNQELCELLLKILIQGIRKDGEAIDIILEGIEINEEDSIIKETFKTIDNYEKEYLIKKKDIKELSPFYTQRKYSVLFQQLFSKEWNRDFNKRIREETLLSLMGKEVILLKGGGWRIGINEDREIQQLKHFQSSVEIPALTFLNPYKEDLVKHTFFRENWDKKNDWRKWLRNFT